MMHTRISRPLLIPLILVGSIIAGCDRGPGPDITSEVQRLNSELEATRVKLEASEKARVTKQQDLAIVAAPAASTAPPPASATPPEKDAQITALKAEIADLKKRDFFAFADASAAMQSGTNSSALEHYQQFLKDFPNSPLAADADRAIAELTTTKEREARARTMLIDPRRPERDALQHFSDGTATLKEIAPLLKNRSAADVVKLLGAPSQTFRDGKEIGYLDRVIDPATGGKGTLVIGFDEEVATTLRVGYLGKPVKF